MKIKFALAGCGAIGARHAAVIDAEPRAELVGVYDIDPARSQGLAQKYGESLARFTSYDDLLAKSGADIVNICTPHGLHSSMAIRASEHGKHILVEKPMALSVADAEAMIRAADRHGVQLMVVKQNRFNVPIVLTKQAMESGHLGKVFMVKCDVLWNRHDGYYNESNWRGRKNLEGGALHTQASHFIDLLNWWFGNVVAAQADLATRNHKIEIEDCGNAILTFESGVMGSITWTTCVYSKNYEGSITIVAENGTIKIGGSYLNKIEYWDVRSLPLREDILFNDKPNAYGKYQGTSSNHDKVVANVIAKLLGERHHVVHGEEGLMSIRAIQKIYDVARWV
jgi:UDP-N-acetyl-2-amino-2-deoxyglucuronate dehydrogenase